MKNLFLLTCILMFACSDANKKSNEIIVCGDDKVMIIDVEKSNEETVKVLWRWQASDVAQQLPEEYQKYLKSIDDCKSVNNNTQLLLTSSSGAVVLLERATRKCLFYAHVPNAHSADCLPSGRIAVVLSINPQGNSIELFEIDKPDQVIFRDSLYSGHGAVWVAERNRFYALGYDELCEYSLKDWDSSTPSLSFEKKWKIPVVSGHDLSLVSGNQLLVSGHEGVYVFDISTEKFIPFQWLKDTPNVKSVNYNETTGQLIYTKAEEDWWTHHIYIHPDKKLTIPDVNLYKVRMKNK